MNKKAVSYWLLAVGFGLMAANVWAQDASPDAAIRETVKKYLDSREQRDAKTLAELFTPDVDQLVSSGEWRKGRDAVVRGTLGSSAATGGHRTITIQTIRFLTPDVALADGPYELAGLKDGQTRSMWTAFLLTRSAGGWKIAAIRNMLPAPPAPVK